MKPIKSSKVTFWKNCLFPLSISSCTSNHHNHVCENGLQNFLKYNIRHNKHGVGRLGSNISLALTSFMKSGLYFMCLAPSYNHKFNLVKSPPAKNYTAARPSSLKLEVITLKFFLQSRDIFSVKFWKCSSLGPMALLNYFC